MSLVVYNTMSGKKEVFQSLEPNKVKLYLCGPTVYDYLHIGNFRGPIVFNLIRNWMEHLGYEVLMAYNYTDVDDKILNRAREEGVEAQEISEKYIAAFERDFKQLGLRPHTYNPKVTDHIDAIIKSVQTLIDNGKAYVVEGEVFYSIESFKKYGQLSKKKLEDLDEGHRVEVDARKRSPHDFVLWKPAKPSEGLSWDSPWGKGRPGWHIECSAMIESIFGSTIDIHGGGVDLIFPHHENEIAQGEGCTGHKYCNYWVHNNFINMDNEKMSKSLGNIMTARSFMENYHPEVLKYLFLSTHYRKVFSVSDDKILQVVAALTRIYSALELAEQTVQAVDGKASPEPSFAQKLEDLDARITKALNDDFNTAEFISMIFEGVRAFNALGFASRPKRTVSHKGNSQVFLNWIGPYAQMSALFQEGPGLMLDVLLDIAVKIRKIDKQKVAELISQRQQAREDKNWQQADNIRDELLSMGVELSDGHARGWRVII